MYFQSEKKFLSFSMAAHSRVLAWKTPWTEEPGRLWSMGSQYSPWFRRVRCDWVTSLYALLRIFLNCFSYNIFPLLSLLLKLLLFRCQDFWANPLIFSLILFPVFNLSVSIRGILPKLCFPYTYQGFNFQDIFFQASYCFFFYKMSVISLICASILETIFLFAYLFAFFPFNSITLQFYLSSSSKRTWWCLQFLCF